jgi:hypothetical protein
MRHALLPPLLACMVLLPAFTRADPDDDDAPAARAPGAALVLTSAQQEAVGVALAHPVKGAGPRQTDAYGLVLDPVELVTDIGRLVTSRSAARNAAADARRLEGLYKNGANASLKALQVAQSLEVESQAQAEAAAATFSLQWGPVAALPDRERDALVSSLTNGHAVLVRADVPGRHALGAMPARALLNVDGIGVAARLLGPVSRTAADLQSAGWLLEVDHPPAGLGPGARLRVTLAGADVAGLLIPTAALLYSEKGAYVYRQKAPQSRDGKTEFATATVKLLTPVGDAWLVSGLADADNVVVHGAGVLWSLQGLGSFSASEEEHD